VACVAPDALVTKPLLTGNQKPLTIDCHKFEIFRASYRVIVIRTRPDLMIKIYEADTSSNYQAWAAMPVADSLKHSFVSRKIHEVQRPQPVSTEMRGDVSTRFGRRLKLLRVERGMTQAVMAKKFGIDRSFISDLERGKKSVSLSTLEIFAIGLELPLSKLLRGI